MIRKDGNKNKRKCKNLKAKYVNLENHTHGEMETMRTHFVGDGEKSRHINGHSNLQNRLIIHTV